MNKSGSERCCAATRDCPRLCSVLRAMSGIRSPLDRGLHARGGSLPAPRETPPPHRSHRRRSSDSRRDHLQQTGLTVAGDSGRVSKLPSTRHTMGSFCVAARAMASGSKISVPIPDKGLSTKYQRNGSLALYLLGQGQNRGHGCASSRRQLRVRATWSFRSAVVAWASRDRARITLKRSAFDQAGNKAAVLHRDAILRQQMRSCAHERGLKPGNKLGLAGVGKSERRQSAPPACGISSWWRKAL